MKKKLLISILCFSILCIGIMYYTFSGNIKFGKSGFKTEKNNNMNNQKEVISMDALQINATKEDVLDTSEIIILGEVVEQLPGKYTNPKGDLVNKMGNIITNAWETSYVVSVKEVYKGKPNNEKEVIVKTWNRVGLPPLDESKYIFETDISEFYLNVGSECIICLAYLAENTLNTDEFGYEVVYGNQGYFEATEKNNKFMSSKLELDLDTIQKDIVDAEQYMAKLRTNTASIISEN